MRIGEVLRYSRPYDPAPATKDGLANYFHETHTPGRKMALLESGINPIQKISAEDFVRRPAILISSSPHKIGSEETPWQDSFDPDRGYVRYYGDNKSFGADPAAAKGNQALLEQFRLHTSPERAQRLKACPILVFKRVTVGGRAKGNVEFQGYGVVERAELVTQAGRQRGSSFSNYVFHFAIFNLAAEHEVFSWDWITARRNAGLRSDEAIECAPSAWHRWVKAGTPEIENCRRRVVRLLTVTTDEQQLVSGSRESRALKDIYDYYHGKKSRFESLAALVAGRVLAAGGQRYRHGWITPGASDGGADFVGRLDLGTGLSTVKVVVLGQAKCEQLNAATGGNHIARTVARLRRGWVGVYVTTSYFSEPVQREILEDRYPILLINGQRLSREVLDAVHEGGFADVKAFLDDLDRKHDTQILQRDPEEILFD